MVNTVLYLSEITANRKHLFSVDGEIALGELLEETTKRKKSHETSPLKGPSRQIRSV
jgi:hypothetical protein